MLLDIQAFKLVTGKINSVNDTTPGLGTISNSTFSGGLVQDYKGMIGGLLAMSPGMASTLSDTTVGTLYAGVYQYVKFKSGTTASNARGQVVFWDDREAFIVTPDATANNIGFVAGITLNAVSKGSYGFIQTKGKASVLFMASVTKATPAIGDLVIVDQTPSNKADVLADATALTGPTARTILGTAIEAAVGGAIKLVELKSFSTELP